MSIMSSSMEPLTHYATILAGGVLLGYFVGNHRSRGHPVVRNEDVQVEEEAAPSSSSSLSRSLLLSSLGLVAGTAILLFNSSSSSSSSSSIGHHDNNVLGHTEPGEGHYLENTISSRRQLKLGRKSKAFDPKTVELRQPNNWPNPSITNDIQLITATDDNFAEAQQEQDIISQQQQQEEQQQLDNFNPYVDLPYSVRDVHVGTMCRCGSMALPVPGQIIWDESAMRNTNIIQPPSKAVPTAKRFIMHYRDGEECTCRENDEAAEFTKDNNLSNLERKCPEEELEERGAPPRSYTWDAMPDLGVEESLPLFVGILSYKAPLSLQGTLKNWKSFNFLSRIKPADVFVQLNKRSEKDDEVMGEYQEQNMNDPFPHPLTLMGSPDENIHPGLAISKFCRAAEAHPSGHPDGENLLLFVEKDWNLRGYFDREDMGYPGDKLNHFFNSINALQQRGVPYVRLTPMIRFPTWDRADYWNCPSQGMPWVCTTAHKHRWANLPSVINCKWFLRYLEPFALLDDPIMYGCRKGFVEKQYCDWEQALADGRVAWTNSQWVVAALSPLMPRLFEHREIDG